MDSAPTSYNIAAIRGLLREAFTDADLRRLCQNDPALRSIVSHFGARFSLEDLIDVVIEQSRTRALFPDLLAAIREVNPRQYERYETKLLVEFPPGEEADESRPGMPAPFLVPFPRNPDFVGRDEDLARLHEMVRQGTSPVGIRPTVLVGLGGIGKTQLAVEYAHVHRVEYAGGIYWINAANPLLVELASLAESLGLAAPDTLRDQAARNAWEYLDARPDALAIFDNVEEPSRLNTPVMPSLIPANLRCRTMFTTRQHDFPRTFQPFEVAVLPEPAALRLLLRARHEIRDDEHHPEWPWARVVCFYLGWLPLAVELAAAYLASYPEVTVRDYLERIRDEGALGTVDDSGVRFEDLPTRVHEMVKGPPQDLSQVHYVAVTATLRTQWNRLDDEAARLIFRAAGQFPQATSMATECLGLLTGMETAARPGYPIPLSRALRKLQAVSLVEELTDDRLRLHPLVQEFAARLSSDAFRLELAANLATALSDFGQLEGHVARRGIDAVVGDVRAALWLCQGNSREHPVHAQLAALERVLDREAHKLRLWNIGSFPAYFGQQIACCAKSLGLTNLAAAAEVHLATKNCPYLRLRWQTRAQNWSLLRTLMGHSDAVTAVAVTPDGRRIVSGSQDGDVMVWDLDTGQRLRRLGRYSSEEDRSVTAVVMTGDGQWVVSGRQNGTVEIWDLDTGQELRTLFGCWYQLAVMAMTPDGKWLVSASSDTMVVRDLDTGQVFGSWSIGIGGDAFEHDVISMAVTSDGRRGVTLLRDHTLRVWDLHTGQELRTLVGQGRGVHSMAMISDRQQVVVATFANSLEVWDLGTGQVAHTVECSTGHKPTAMTVTQDGRWIVSASEEDNSLRVWSLHTGQVLRTLSGHTARVTAVTTTPDGRQAVSASVDRTLRVWDISPDAGPEIGHEGSMPGEHTAAVRAVAVTSDGRRIVSGSDDRTLRVWNADTGQILRTLPGLSESVSAVAATPDAQQVVSGSCDDVVRVWNLDTGQEVRTLADDIQWVDGVALKRTVSGAGQDMSTFWDRILRPDSGTAVAVTPDGRRIVSGLWDGSVEVWDLDAEQVPRTLVGHTDSVTAVAVVPDGKRIVSASADKWLRVWDLETGQVVRILKGHKSAVLAVCVSPDGQWVVSGSDDGMLRVWNLRTGRVLRELTGHRDRVVAVAMMPDWAAGTFSRRVVSASHDHTLRVWDLDTGQEIICFEDDWLVEALAVVPDDQRIIAGNADGNLYSLEYVHPQSSVDLERAAHAALYRPDHNARWNATHALGRIWQLSELTRLGDRSAKVRHGSAVSLGKLGDERAVQPLIAALEDPEPTVRQAAVQALVELGDAATGPLIGALQARRGEIQQGAATALGMQSAVQAVVPLLAALQSRDARVRQSIVLALGQLHDAQAVEPLIAAFRGEVVLVRRAIVRVLADLARGLQGDLLQQTTELLDAASREADREIRQKATAALEQLGLPSKKVPDRTAAPTRPASRTAPGKKPARTWQDILAEWGLQVPDAQRIERAREIIQSGNIAAIDRKQTTYSIEHVTICLWWEKNRCDCSDFQYRQRPAGKACKHLVALAMYLEEA